MGHFLENDLLIDLELVLANGNVILEDTGH